MNLHDILYNIDDTIVMALAEAAADTGTSASIKQSVRMVCRHTFSIGGQDDSERVSGIYCG